MEDHNEGAHNYERIRIMASATWRSRLLKLNLALVAKEKASSRKSRPRRLRPRLAAEQLEDRTLPSGGIQLLEPAVHPPPTPPPQGPAAQAPPSPASNDNGPGQEKSVNPQGPAAQKSLSSANSGQEEDTPTSTQGPAAQNSLSPANNDQGEANTPSSPGSAGQGARSLTNNANGQGQNNTPAPQGPAAEEPPASASNDNGQGQENPPNSQRPTARGLEGYHSSTPLPPGRAAEEPPSTANNGPGQNNPSPELAANGPGNGNGQGEGEGSSGATENAQPTLASGPRTGNQPSSAPESEANGPGNDNGQGIDDGQTASPAPSVSPAALVSSGIRAVSTQLAQGASAAERAVSAEAAQGASAAEAFAQTLLADESIALGVIASEGGLAEPAASPSRGSPPAPGGNNGEVAVPDVGTGSSGGGMPLLIASSPMPSAGAISAFITKLQESSTKDEFKPSMTDLPISRLDRLFLEWWDDDQLLFPDTMPAIDEMLFPESMPQIDDMPLPNEQLPLGEDAPFGLERLSQAPAAALGQEDVVAFDALSASNGETPLFAPISQPVPANQWLESVSAAPAAAEEPAAGDNIRPYHIALGMMPFLVAFGYTPSSLRDHVQVGQRVWKRLRGYLRRKPLGSPF